MPIDAGVLAQAMAAQARLVDAERDVEVARAEFHLTVRRLQRAGASVGELAAALGLSRQHVHQIVESDAERQSRRGGRLGAGDLLSCTFCGKNQKHVAKLIAGPGAYICNECVERGHAVLAAAKATASTPIATIARAGAADGAEPCSFCGKRRQQVAAMASTDHAAICNECLDLCDEIIAEELA